MKEKDIIYSESPYWVMKAPDKLFYVMRDGVTHATSIDDIGYLDSSLAIAYCKYQAKRQVKHG